LNSGVYKVGAIEPSNRWCFKIEKTKNITIRGRGVATEIISSAPQAGVFELYDCEGVLLKDFAIDYDPLPFTQGIIIDTNLASGTFDMEIDPCFPSLSQYWFKQAPLKLSSIFEPNVPRLKAGASDHLFLSSWTHLHDRVWRIQAKAGYHEKVAFMSAGDRFVQVARTIQCHAVFINRCRSTKIENIVIYASPAGAMIPAENEGIIIRGLTVRRRPNSMRLISSNADGIHCPRNRKGLLIENCYLEGMLDDGMNIYTTPNLVIEVYSPTKLLVTNTYHFIRIGDRLQILDPRSGNIRDEVVAVDVQDGPKGYVITLDRPVVGITAGKDHRDSDTIYNLSACGYIIRNNHITDGRRHGILLRAGDGLVERNAIEKVAGLGIVVCNEPGWPEGPAGQGIKICNNKISDVGYSAEFCRGNDDITKACIQIKGLKLEWALAEGHILRDIVIENNRIVNPPGAAIFVGAADNVKIIGNRSRSAFATGIGQGVGSILLANCNRVVIDNYNVTDSQPETTCAVEILSSVSPGKSGVTIGTINADLYPGAPLVIDKRLP
jgi:hypothetical protein